MTNNVEFGYFSLTIAGYKPLKKLLCPNMLETFSNSKL